MKLAAYIRVSTEEQGTGDGPDGQRRAITAWAAQNGVEIVGWAEDIGTSGAVSPFQRQGVRDAVALAQRHGAEGVVVDKADRWTRGGLEDGVLSRAQLAKEHRLTLHIVDMPFGMDRLVGQIILAIRDAMAAEWLRTHKERVTRGARAAKDKGWPNGKPGRPQKPDLTVQELDAVVHGLADGLGWPKLARKVSEMRGAFTMATVKLQKQKQVSETWLRQRVTARAKENMVVSLTLKRRGIETSRSNVDDSEGVA